MYRAAVMACPTVSLAGFAFCLTASPAVAAGSFFASYFPATAVAPDCYARSYDVQHLAAHPQQRVVRFALQLADTTTPSGFMISYNFTLRGSADTFGGLVHCTERSGGAVCQGENGGQDFNLSGTGKDVTLTVGVTLKPEWGANHASGPDLAIGGDDRVFLLLPTRGQTCTS